MQLKALRVLGKLIRRLLFYFYGVKSRCFGKLYLSRFTVGKGLVYHVPVRFEGGGTLVVSDGVKLGYYMAPRLGTGGILIQSRGPESNIFIGKATALSNNVTVMARKSVRIGANCLIGDCVQIVDSDFHGISPTKRHSTSGESEEVVIGENVWLGSRVIVLKGANIGDGSIIGAGSVVVGEIPSGVIAGGVPAKVIRQLNG